MGGGGDSRILHVGMGAFALQNCMVMKLFLLCFQRNIAKFLKIFRLFIYKSLSLSVFIAFCIMFIMHYSLNK